MNIKGMKQGAQYSKPTIQPGLEKGKMMDLSHSSQSLVDIMGFSSLTFMSGLPIRMCVANFGMLEAASKGEYSFSLVTRKVALETVSLLGGHFCCILEHSKRLAYSLIYWLSPITFYYLISPDESLPFFEESSRVQGEKQFVHSHKILWCK